MIKKILRHMQYLLIRLIVGKRQVMMNTTIRDGYVIAKPDSILINDTLTDIGISGDSTTISPVKAGKEIKIEMFQDKNRKWRFRLVSSNKKILCSSEAYSRKNYCQHTVDLIRKAKILVMKK